MSSEEKGNKALELLCFADVGCCWAVSARWGSTVMLHLLPLFFVALYPALEGAYADTQAACCLPSIIALLT